MSYLYLDADDVVAVNLSVLGPSAHLLRDSGLLESAVARPQAGFGDYEEYPDIWSKAVAFAEGISRNHPFMDGNKRTAWVSAQVFLEINDQDSHPYGEEADDFMVRLAQNGFESIDKAVREFRRICEGS